MTIKDIERQLEATEKAREQLVKTKRESDQLALEYRARADEAASIGNVESYKELKALADDAEAVAYVCGKQLEAEQANPITIEQTRVAWDVYAKEYNKKLAAKISKFETLKADLLREYAEAVELQKEACATREWLADVVQQKPTRAEGEGSLRYRYPMSYLPCVGGNEQPQLRIGGAVIHDPDAVYYLASWKLDSVKLQADPRTSKFCSVLMSHRAD